MISFNYEQIDFRLNREEETSKWISDTIENENCLEGDINYIFCSDEYLYKLNVDYLKHNTLTDIISFDYSVGKRLHGDIYISVERVKDNAIGFNVDFKDELARVLIHGILHYCGYKDKTDDEKKLMRFKEDFYLERR